MEATLERVRPLMRDLKIPQHYDKVFKDECVFTFDTPYSEKGLCVSLRSWLGVSPDYLSVDVQRVGGAGGLYLLQKFKRVPKEKPADGPVAVEPTKLAIGVAGGFLAEDKFEIQKAYSLLVLDASGGKSDEVALPCEELPTIVASVCDAIIAHQGAKSMDDTNRWEADIDIKESKYAKELVQLPATKKISPNPADWKCEISGDTQNLWLNLSDGFIGGGRKHFDGTGGSNGALDHFKEESDKGNFYPLSVKLGTITPQGADVFSYAKDEDDLVKDPLLAEHLAHWGIDVMKMEKTEKTMAEMEVDLNTNYDWSKICETSGELVRLRGPGLVGLKNLGNSCYLNSSVQLLLGLPESKARYADGDFAIRRQAPSDVSTDLVSQVAKLTSGIMSERYAPAWKDGDDEDDPQYLVSPQMFWSLIGKGHSEFSSNRQQDAGEFLSYFLDKLSRAEKTALGSRLEAGKPLASLFEFAVEERKEQQTESKGVLYTRQKQNMLMLPIKIDDAENLAEVMAYRSAHGGSEEKEAKKPKTEGEPEEPKPIIQMKSALDRWAAPEDGIEFRGAKASKTTRLATMPRYLLMQVQRYSVNEKWMPVKIDCKVPMPESISLEHLRGKGLQPGETELKDDSPPPATATSTSPAAPQPDDTIVAQLLSMGLSENGAKRACLGVQNASADMAATWYFEHMEDPDINDPLPASGGGGTGGTGTAGPDPTAVAELSSFGFAEKHVIAALKACGNSSERAADWLFSHSDDLDGAVAALGGGGDSGGDDKGSAEDYDDGVGEYSLVGFISHIGKHPSHGHYVCHARRGLGGEWVLFNDQKVAQSEAPPLDLGYIYLYRRKDAA